jgi:hypothetical protein
VNDYTPIRPATPKLLGNNSRYKFQHGVDTDIVPAKLQDPMRVCLYCAATGKSLHGRLERFIQEQVAYFFMRALIGIGF